MTTLSDLMDTIKNARQDFADRDDRIHAKIRTLETAFNEIARKAGRPFAGDDGVDETRSAIDWLQCKHLTHATKRDARAPLFTPTQDAISEAQVARRGLKRMLSATEHAMLPAEEQKALSQFAVAANEFILPSELYSRVLTCLEDRDDFSSQVGREVISGAGIKFLNDDVEDLSAAWECDDSCYPAGPSNDMLKGLGETEFRPEPLRSYVCVARTTLEDAAINLENWVLRKADKGMRGKLSAAIVGGDGIGKPQGILHPGSGIPVYSPGASTPPGQFSWQDLVTLRYSLAPQYQAGASFLMNNVTFTLLSTMSDAMGRPLWMPYPGDATRPMIAGAPVTITSWMPDPVPGSTPVAYGNWKDAYLLVQRSNVSMLQESRGWCLIFLFQARFAGSVVCPSAARLLRMT